VGLGPVRRTSTFVIEPWSPTTTLALRQVNRWLCGWQLQGVFSSQTGVPVPIFGLNGDSNEDGLTGSDRPEYAPGFNGPT